MKTKIIFQAFALLMCFAGCTRQTQKAHITEKQDSIIIERALMPSDNIIIFNPDQSMKQNQTICALIDLYNGYEYLRVLWSEFELWYVKDMAVEHEAATTHSLFFDEKLRAYADKYNMGLVACIPGDRHILSKQGYDPVDKKLRLYSAMDAYSSFMQILDSNYESQFNTKDTIIPTGTLRTQIDNQFLNVINRAVLFDFQDSSKGEQIIKELENLMNSERYSSYLFEAWRIWRIISQVNEYGLSRNAPISNLSYNSMRMKCATTILRYLIKNKNDYDLIQSASSQFIWLASWGNLYRIHPLFPDCTDSQNFNPIVVELYNLGFFPKASCNFE